MRIIYVCPMCGADLVDSVIDTNPPIRQKICSRCDWRWEEDPEEVVRIPFVPPDRTPVLPDGMEYMFGGEPADTKNRKDDEH